MCIGGATTPVERENITICSLWNPVQTHNVREIYVAGNLNYVGLSDPPPRPDSRRQRPRGHFTRVVLAAPTWGANPTFPPWRRNKHASRTPLLEEPANLQRRRHSGPRKSNTAKLEEMKKSSCRAAKRRKNMETPAVAVDRMAQSCPQAPLGRPVGESFLASGPWVWFY